MGSWNYWTMRNTVAYQRPILRIIDVSKRSYDAQRKAGK